MVGSPLVVATRAKRVLKALARPAGRFDASRYFRGGHDLVFYNIRSSTVRALARSIVQANRDWSVDDAMRLAGALMPARPLEVKGLAVEVVARYRRGFRPAFLAVWKRWLAQSWAANWATTDAMCGVLIGPLIVDQPQLSPRVRAWVRHRNLWVRRAAAVSLIPSVRRGQLLDVGYAVASDLHGDGEDLIQKAVGWLLREAGKGDPARLEAYLRGQAPRLPRITLRYAIERFPLRTRQALLRSTRAPGAHRA